MKKRNQSAFLWLPALFILTLFDATLLHGFSEVKFVPRVGPFNPMKSTRPSISGECSRARTSSLNSVNCRDEENQSAGSNLDNINEATQPKPNLNTPNRRIVLLFLASVATTPFALSGFPQPSEASYSAYVRREQDWEERKNNGEVEYSSARALRSQLREIVPQNSESSKIFCPNGPSAAVSPLMENKCGDRVAAPSVYGRSNDGLGNSIPGYSDQWKGGSGGSGGSIADGAYGFPSYSGTSGRSNLK